MHWEVEQKFRVESDRIEAAFATLGVRFSASQLQCDHYFNHPARDFATTDEAFRIRQAGNQNYVTYKGPKIDPHTKTRQELELPLPEGPEIAARFAEVLLALGFRPAGVVAKARRTGQLTWEGHPTEVVLDQVQGLGSFLEIEITASNDNLTTAQTAIKSLSAKLGLESPERRSYLELLLIESP